MLQVEIGDQTVGEALDFVGAVVEPGGLAELAAEAVNLQVLEDEEGVTDFGVGVELDADEAVDDL